MEPFVVVGGVGVGALGQAQGHRVNVDIRERRLLAGGARVQVVTGAETKRVMAG